MSRYFSTLITLLAGLAGLAAFLAPLFQRVWGTAVSSSGSALLAALLLIFSLGVLIIEMQGQVLGAKMVAALGVLVAVTAVLRFLEVAIPGPAGFSPIFAPIIMVGFVFGSRFGFLLGAMTLFVSSLITGAVGPWLPYQMFAAGWVGLTAAWLPGSLPPRRQLLRLAIFGAAWGWLYGLLMNLYFWPFLLEGTAVSGLIDALRQYALFYLASSFMWDAARALGNFLFIILLGRPILRVLARFQERFDFDRLAVYKDDPQRV